MGFIERTNASRCGDGELRPVRGGNGVRVRGLVVAIAVCVLALSGAFSMQASAARAADWELQAQVKGEMSRPNVPLLGISCPSIRLCVAVGELDKVLSSTNPIGDPRPGRRRGPPGKPKPTVRRTGIPLVRTRRIGGSEACRVRRQDSASPSREKAISTLRPIRPALGMPGGSLTSTTTAATPTC